MFQLFSNISRSLLVLFRQGQYFRARNTSDHASQRIDQFKHFSLREPRVFGKTAQFRSCSPNGYKTLNRCRFPLLNMYIIHAYTIEFKSLMCFQFVQIDSSFQLVFPFVFKFGVLSSDVVIFLLFCEFFSCIDSSASTWSWLLPLTEAHNTPP